MDLRTWRSLPAAGGSPAAGRAVALARLLHRDCARLLELYEAKESFTADVTPAKERIVALPPTSPRLSPEERLWILHSALRQCLELLEAAMRREKEAFGTEVEGDYERAQKIVKDRLGDLFQSTKLLSGREGVTVLSPQTEVADGSENGSSFALKVWIYRVLQELMYWIQCASETLPTLQPERETKSGVTRRRVSREKRAARK